MLVVIVALFGVGTRSMDSFGTGTSAAAPSTSASSIRSSGISAASRLRPAAFGASRTCWATISFRLSVCLRLCTGYERDRRRSSPRRRRSLPHPSCRCSYLPVAGFPRVPRSALRSRTAAFGVSSGRRRSTFTRWRSRRSRLGRRCWRWTDHDGCCSGSRSRHARIKEDHILRPARCYLVVRGDAVRA